MFYKYLSLWLIKDVPREISFSSHSFAFSRILSCFLHWFRSLAHRLSKMPIPIILPVAYHTILITREIIKLMLCKKSTMNSSPPQMIWKCILFAFWYDWWFSSWNRYSLTNAGRITCGPQFTSCSPKLYVKHHLNLAEKLTASRWILFSFCILENPFLKELDCLQLSP